MKRTSRSRVGGSELNRVVEIYARLEDIEAAVGRIVAEEELEVVLRALALVVAVCGIRRNSESTTMYLNAVEPGPK